MEILKSFSPYSEAEADLIMQPEFKMDAEAWATAKALAVAKESSLEVSRLNGTHLSSTPDANEIDPELEKLLDSLVHSPMDQPNPVDGGFTHAMWKHDQKSRAAAQHTLTAPTGIGNPLVSGTTCVPAPVTHSDEETPATATMPSHPASIAVKGTSITLAPTTDSKSSPLPPVSPRLTTASTISAASSTTTKVKAGAFPISHISQVREFADPVRELDALCRALADHGDYERVRNDYCHISIGMNLHGKQAPAFRQQLKTNAKGGSAVHMAIHRDGIVVDLHWCQATGMNVLPEDIAHRAIFDAVAAFPFNQAWTFATQKWKSTYRADEALCITPFQQCQLNRIRNKTIENHSKELLTGWKSTGEKSQSLVSVARGKVNRWAEKDSRILPLRDDYVALWLARQLLGDVPLPSQIAQLHALMTGAPVRGNKTTSDKLKRLDHCLKTY